MKQFILGILTLISFAANGQLNVTSGGLSSDPNHLVQNVLLGEGIITANVTSGGAEQQLGLFSNGLDIIGIEEGIILSTGTATDASDLSSFNIKSTEFANATNDNDLFLLSGNMKSTMQTEYGITIDPVSSTADVVYLEFDFIPRSDKLEIQFVFASEEYSDYIYSAFNDMFGFFISGPQISGQYSAPVEFPNGAKNIALVPNTNLPITVSSIHNGNATGVQPFNNQFYIDNCKTQVGNACESEGTSFNGYTVVLTATADVVPCKKHHIKIALGDGSEDDIDSGVLIAAKSFASKSFTAEYTPDFYLTGDINEGCSYALVDVNREGDLSKRDTVFIDLLPGSQAQKNDFTTFTDTIIFAPGESIKKALFEATPDGIAEGPEEVRMQIYLSGGCAAQDNEINFTIFDENPLKFTDPNTEKVQAKCAGVEVSIEALLEGGIEPYLYSWFVNGQNTSENTNIFKIEPNISDTVTVQVLDQCGGLAIEKDFVFEFNTLPPLEFELPNDTTLPCPIQQLSIQPKILSGGSGIYEVDYKVNNQPAGKYADGKIVVDATKNLEIIAEASDECGNIATDTMLVNVTGSAPIDLSIPNDTTICANEPLLLAVSAEGGATPYTIQWEGFGSNQNSFLVFPTRDTSYSVTITDNCQQTKTARLFVDVNYIIPNFEYDYSDVLDLQLINTSVAKQPIYHWYINNELVSMEESPFISLQSVFDQYVTLAVEDRDGCQDTISKIIPPQLRFYMPTAFTPDGDDINDVFHVYGDLADEFYMRVFDRWGRIVFETNNQELGWNGVIPASGEIVEGSYTVLVEAKRGLEKVKYRQLLHLFK